MGLEAYRKALEIGETFDRRTKIALIGQDRVGKTSLRKYLRGEAFDKDEASTPGIEMISPVKNAGIGVWKNPAPLENTSPLDHKLAEVVAKELLSSPKKRQQSAQPFPGEGERGEPTSGKRATQEHSNGKVKLATALKLASFFTDSSYQRGYSRLKKTAAQSPVKMNGQTNFSASISKYMYFYLLFHSQFITKSSVIKTRRFGDDMSPLSNVKLL